MSAEGDATRAVFQSLARELRAIRASLERIEEVVAEAAGETQPLIPSLSRDDEKPSAVLAPPLISGMSRDEDALPAVLRQSGPSPDESAFDLRSRDERVSPPPTSAPAPDDFFSMLGLDPAAVSQGAGSEETPFDPFAGLGSSGTSAPPNADIRVGATDGGGTASNPFAATPPESGSLELPDPFAEVADASPAKMFGAEATLSGGDSGVPSDDELLQLLGSVNATSDSAGSARAAGRPTPGRSDERPPRPNEAASIATASAMATADAALDRAASASREDAGKFDMSPEDLESIFGWKS